MYSTIALIAAALLVAGVVVVAIPNVAQADPPHQWCINDIGGDCFKSKGECRKNCPPDVGPCFKNSVP